MDGSTQSLSSPMETRSLAQAVFGRAFPLGMPPESFTRRSMHALETAPVDVDRVASLMVPRRRVGVGQPLYHKGDPFRYIYVVCSGTFKSNIMFSDGREQVSGFHMAGDLMGLDGAADGTHASSVRALYGAQACALPYGKLTALASTNLQVQLLLNRLMSLEIVGKHALMMMLGGMNAEERLLAFLLNLSGRFKACGYSSSDFRLPMTRAEIGSYLGLTLETVSRTFSALQQRRMLEVDKRHIRIINLEDLTRAFERVHMH